MSDFKQEWTVESAMEILGHPTVDSKIWADAVEWLILHGPPEIQEMLKQASGYATHMEFPQLKPEGYTEDGEPIYSVSEIARALNIAEDEAAELIAEKERKHGVLHRYGTQGARKVQ